MAYHIKLLLSARALNQRGPVVGDVEDCYDEDDEVDGTVKMMKLMLKMSVRVLNRKEHAEVCC